MSDDEASSGFSKALVEEIASVFLYIAMFFYIGINIRIFSDPYLTVRDYELLELNFYIAMVFFTAWLCAEVIKKILYKRSFKDWFNHLTQKFLRAFSVIFVLWIILFAIAFIIGIIYGITLLI